MPHNSLLVSALTMFALAAASQPHAQDGALSSPRAYAMDPTMGQWLVHPCSRAGPYLGRSPMYWQPTEAQIQEVERAVDEAIEARKVNGKEASPLPLSAHVRRYIGVTTDRGVIIYGHIISPSWLHGADPQTLRASACHGRLDDWGIEFDVTLGSVTDISFSAGGPPGSRP